MSEIVFFDLETTGPGGPDPDVDRIVQFSFGMIEGTAYDALTEIVHPGDDALPIPEERTEVHGIATEDVKGEPPFEAFAGMIQNIVGDAVLCGYGIRGYDVPILHRHLLEAGQRGLRSDEGTGIITHPEIDLLEAWRRHEPRNLSSADDRFGRGTLGDDAHDAGADTAVLPAILSGMMTEFELPTPGLGDSLEDLVEACRPEGAMDRAGCFRRTEEDVVVFGFSKHRGDPVADHPGMLEWMLDRDFPDETLRVARVLLRRVRGEGRSGT